MPDIIDLKETQSELEWLKTKLSIRARKLQGQRLPFVHHGEVYRCLFGYNLGSEMRGEHPCVIIQNNANSATLNTAIVAPITHATNRKKTSSLLVPITPQHGANGAVTLEGYVDVANMKTVSKARLISMITTLPGSDMKKVDKALAVALDVYGYYSDQAKKLETAIKRADAKEQKIKALRNALMKIQDSVPPDIPEIITKTILDALNL